MVYHNLELTVLMFSINYKKILEYHKIYKNHNNLNKTKRKENIPVKIYYLEKKNKLNKLNKIVLN